MTKMEHSINKEGGTFKRQENTQVIKLFDLSQKSTMQDLFRFFWVCLVTLVVGVGVDLVFYP